MSAGKLKQSTVLAALTSVLLAVGCGGGDSDNGSDKTTAKTDSTTSTVDAAGYNDCGSVEKGGGFNVRAKRVSCRFARRWVLSDGRRNPKGWKCSGGHGDVALGTPQARASYFGRCNKGSAYFRWDSTPDETTTDETTTQITPGGGG